LAVNIITLKWTLEQNHIEFIATLGADKSALDFKVEIEITKLCDQHEKATVLGQKLNALERIQYFTNSYELKSCITNIDSVVKSLNRDALLVRDTLNDETNTQENKENEVQTLTEAIPLSTEEEIALKEKEKRQLYQELQKSNNSIEDIDRLENDLKAIDAEVEAIVLDATNNDPTITDNLSNIEKQHTDIKELENKLNREIPNENEVEINRVSK
jgi:hypothetical protein